MPVKRWETNMQRNEKHDKNLPHQPPWLGSGFGGPLWKATWLPVQVVQGGMHARAKDMTGPEYLLERALTKRFLRFAAFLAFLRLDFISFRNEVRSWVSFLISSWMTSWQQERTPKGGPDLGSISGTGTNGLDSRCLPRYRLMTQSKLDHRCLHHCYASIGTQGNTRAFVQQTSAQGLPHGQEQADELASALR